MVFTYRNRRLGAVQNLNNAVCQNLTEVPKLHNDLEVLYLTIMYIYCNIVTLRMSKTILCYTLSTYYAKSQYSSQDLTSTARPEGTYCLGMCTRNSTLTNYADCHCVQDIRV